MGKGEDGEGKLPWLTSCPICSPSLRVGKRGSCLGHSTGACMTACWECPGKGMCRVPLVGSSNCGSGLRLAEVDVGVLPALFVGAPVGVLYTPYLPPGSLDLFSWSSYSPGGCESKIRWAAGPILMRPLWLLLAVCSADLYSWRH